jgi:hypothetical protein
VRAAGFSARHTLIATTDYAALPRLVESAQRFDFIFIDGYHAFDYVMLDAFYADLLLKPGGTLVLHDSNCAAVYHACRFIANNKAYRLIGPPLAIALPSLARRVARRLGHEVTGRGAAFRERRLRWRSLAAFAKEADKMSDQFTLRGF